MKIAWDLDGVLRDILGYLEITTNDYNNVPSIKNMSFIEYLKTYPEVYVNALPTEYLKVALQFKPIFILTTYISFEQILANQFWCYKYLGFDYEIKYVKTTERKLNWLERNPDGILIEDYPFNLDRVIIVDRPYNRNVNVKHRVKNEKELGEILKCWK